MIISTQPITNQDLDELHQRGGGLHRIVYECGHTLLTLRYGGCPAAGDDEPCPVCGGDTTIRPPVE